MEEGGVDMSKKLERKWKKGRGGGEETIWESEGGFFPGFTFFLLPILEQERIFSSNVQSWSRVKLVNFLGD